MASLRLTLRSLGVSHRSCPRFPLSRITSNTFRGFATNLSPPSKAVVYEQQGPPDQVTRSIPSPFNLLLLLWIFLILNQILPLVGYPSPGLVTSISLSSLSIRLVKDVIVRHRQHLLVFNVITLLGV